MSVCKCLSLRDFIRHELEGIAVPLCPTHDAPAAVAVDTSSMPLNSPTEAFAAALGMTATTSDARRPVDAPD